MRAVGSGPGLPGGGAAGSAIVLANRIPRQPGIEAHRRHHGDDDDAGEREAAPTGCSRAGRAATHFYGV